MIRPKKTIENIIPYQTDKYRTDWRLKLDSNENIYGVSPLITSVIKNIDTKEISLYPCYGELIELLAKKYKLDEFNFLLSNGCDEALNIIINTYLDYGDEILSFNPTFSMPHLYAKIAGADIKLVEYDEKFVFSAQKLAKNISDKTKIVYIATPNNPTGEIASYDDLMHLIQDFPDVLFIVDCTYVNYAQNVRLEDYLELTKLQNAIVLKSFSKDFALAGLRIGFSAASREVIQNLKKTASPYNVNIVALKCAVAALKNEKMFDDIKQANNTSKELLIQGLFEAGFKPYPTEGNFVLCDFSNYSDFYYEKLKKNGVIVRKFSKNSPISTCLRITVPKIGGVKYILELLKKKDVLIFDLDGVVFDVSESYTGAIIETYKRLSGKNLSKKEIEEAKTRGGLNCDWDVVDYFLKHNEIEVEYEKIVNLFQDLFYNPAKKAKNDKKFLIDKEKLLISKEIFEELSQAYDLVIFSGRPRAEIDYSINKEGLDKFFYYIISCDDLDKDRLKPEPDGVLDILEHCPYLSIKYIGDSIDDAMAASASGVELIGVISSETTKNVVVNNFKHLGVKNILDSIDGLRDLLKKTDENYAKQC